MRYLLKYSDIFNSKGVELLEAIVDLQMSLKDKQFPWYHWNQKAL